MRRCNSSLADRLVDVNELDRARAIYDTMLRNGGDASGYAGLARVLRKMQKSDELLEALGRGFAKGDVAIGTLEPEIKAVSQDKALIGMLIDSGRAKAKAHRLKFEEAYLLAKFAAALKDADASGEFYLLAIASNRNGERPSVLIQMEMGEMYSKLRKYGRAVDVYKEILGSKQLNEMGQGIDLFIAGPGIGLRQSHGRGAGSHFEGDQSGRRQSRVSLFGSLDLQPCQTLGRGDSQIRSSDERLSGQTR